MTIYSLTVELFALSLVVGITTGLLVILFLILFPNGRSQ